jgi:hypothetical protein
MKANIGGKIVNQRRKIVSLTSGNNACIPDRCLSELDGEYDSKLRPAEKAICRTAFKQGVMIGIDLGGCDVRWYLTETWNNRDRYLEVSKRKGV